MMEDKPPEEVFADTCVLLNFIQQEWETTRSKSLVESELVEIIVSESVMSELDNVSNRRTDIYKDLIDFLMEEEGDIENYGLDDRHVYIGENDAKHIRDIQMTLASLDDSREVLRRFRRYLKALDRRLKFLEQQLEDNVVFPSGSLELEFAVHGLIGNDNDATIVTDAAGWTADGGSGILVTLDSGDLLDYKDEISDLLEEEVGSEWILDIRTPESVPTEPPTEVE
jgi:predicted nucleic acid-binding protein